MKRGMAGLVAAAAAMALASPAAANDTSCVGALTGPHDNVVVPTGAAYTLVNADVKGNVKALENSRLNVSNSRIGGNVEGDKADLVQVHSGSIVRGNVLIKEGGPATSGGTFLCSGGGPFTPCEVALLNITIEGGNTQVEKMTGDIAVGDVIFGGTRVRKGNVKVEENFTPAGNLFQIRDNDIAENLQVFKNRGPGSKVVVNNRVGEDLQCFENAAPFTGGPNTAAKAEGQCF